MASKKASTVPLYPACPALTAVYPGPSVCGAEGPLCLQVLRALVWEKSLPPGSLVQSAAQLLVGGGLDFVCLRCFYAFTEGGPLGLRVWEWST